MERFVEDVLHGNNGDAVDRCLRHGVLERLRRQIDGDRRPRERSEGDDADAAFWPLWKSGNDTERKGMNKQTEN